MLRYQAEPPGCRGPPPGLGAWDPGARVRADPWRR